MTLGTFLVTYHTAFSLLFGPSLVYCVFRWLKVHPAWKVGLSLVVMFLTIGLWGIVLNVGLAIALAIAYFIGSPAIWIGGLVALGVWGDVQYSDLAWWQTFLICGVWGLISQLLSFGLRKR